jgi:hypothetical protein
LGHESSDTSFSYSTINLTNEPEPEPELEEKEEQDEKEPEPTHSQTYTKLDSRKAPLEDKLALLEKIYKDHGNSITNVKLRKLSGIGSRTVNDFLKSKA